MKEINNNIQENYCSYEVSKLLKEKGFDVPLCSFWSFTENNELYISEWLVKSSISDLDKIHSGKILAPTHALAIEWLRINFGIWIWAEMFNNGDHFASTVVDHSNQFRYQSCILPTPQEAIELALICVLKELI